MIERIKELRKEGDSAGGLVELVGRGLPVGLGEPVFDRLEADLAKAMLSLPATKGFEVGSGFDGTRLTGSAHNDAFYKDGDEVRTRSNNSGGVVSGVGRVEAQWYPSGTEGGEGYQREGHQVPGRSATGGLMLPRGLLLGCARLFMLSQYHTLAMMNPMTKAVRCWST